MHTPYLIVAAAASAGATGIWIPLGVIAAFVTVVVTIILAWLAVRNSNRKVASTKLEAARKLADEEKAEQTKLLDALTLAVVGKPASPDGTFKKVDGLVDDFANYVAVRTSHDIKIDGDITEIFRRLDEVTAEYKTNGGSTVKDDLITLRRGVSDLRQAIRGVVDGQTTAATLALDANITATVSREGLAQGQEDARVLVAAEHTATHPPK